MTQKKKILLLTSAREDGWLRNALTEVGQGLHTFAKAFNNDDELEMFVSTLDELDFVVCDDSVSIFDRYNNVDIADYDLIHLRNVTLFKDFARAITIYMEYHKKQIFEGVDTDIPEYGKLSQMVLFALNNVAIPATLASWNATGMKELIRKQGLSYPFILKANDAIKGHDNYLVKNDEELAQIFNNSSEIQFVAQEFIPNDGDFRVLYFANNPPLIFKRVAASGSHLNNTSRGGSSYEISPEKFDQNALQLAHRAAHLTRRQLAGVDVIQDNKTGKWAILEVNANPALSSGTLLEQKIDGYKKMIKGVL